MNHQELLAELDRLIEAYQHGSGVDDFCQDVEKAYKARMKTFFTTGE